jgi:tetratricopeptide (TPR) repeat protein
MLHLLTALRNTAFTLAAIFLFILAPVRAEAQTKVLIDDSAFMQDAKTAIDSLYNRNDDAARQILSPWFEQYPDHPLWLLWDGMELWWKVLEDLTNEEFDDEFFRKMQVADYEAGRLIRRQSDHPDALIIRAVANGYAARHNANRGNWVTSVNIGRRAYQAYTRLMEVKPGLPDNDFAIGMKRYYAAYIPENFPMARAVSWFLPDGDRQAGLEALDAASNNGVFARPEAAYFLGFIQLNYEQDYEIAARVFQDLIERYPDNGYYRRLHLSSLAQMRRFYDLGIAAEHTIGHWEKTRPGEKNVLHEEVYHWLGRSQYHAGDFEQALQSFVKSFETGLQLPNKREREYHTASAYFAGRTSELLNNGSDAEWFYKAALEQKAGDQVKRQARERLSRIQ